jgi:hypothetical protein
MHILEKDLLIDNEQRSLVKVIRLHTPCSLQPFNDCKVTGMV